MIPGRFHRPKKLCQAQHEDTAGCWATNMVLQKTVPVFPINYVSVSYDQDAICVGPRNKITDGNPVSNRRLHGTWYLLESILDFCVGNSCTKRKIWALTAHAGDNTFCAVVKLFKTWLYPCFLALAMLVPCRCIMQNYLSFGGKANTILQSHTTS